MLGSNIRYLQCPEPITRCEPWIDRDTHEKRRHFMLRVKVGGTRTLRPQPVPC